MRSTHGAPRSGVPFGTGESVARLFDTRPFARALGVVDGDAPSVGVLGVAVDDAVLRALVAARLRTRLEFPFEPSTEATY
jgi:hypothetical protein